MDDKKLDVEELMHTRQLEALAAIKRHEAFRLRHAGYAKRKEARKKRINLRLVVDNT